MNIFYLDASPKVCAEMHLDKHVVKMILEYAQLLSTAHRILDGVPTQSFSGSGRRKTIYRLPDERDTVLYSATHANHPSAIWVRQSYANYVWLHRLLHYLCKEYTHRYGKIHKVEHGGLLSALYLTPSALDKTKGITFTEPTPAMPDTYKVKNDSINSYRNYYIHDKVRFAKWTKRPMPQWFSEGVQYANV